MFRESQTEVLVVGAGPVGMLTALALAQQGVRSEVIDKEEQTAAHSHACALHPQTFRLLAQMEMADEVLAVGHKIDRIAFYEGDSRRAEVNFSKLPGGFPFVVVVPQNELEELFERRLAQHAATRIQWLHRLADLQPQEGDTVLATVDKLCQTAKGYPVATFQHVVQKTIRTQAAFVVGADGRDSHARQLLKIEHETAGRPECFAVFEFESDAKFSNEVRVVLHNGTSNVLWPLPGKRWRWTFQIAPEEVPDEYLKDRVHFRYVDPPADQEVLRRMHRLVEQRAPWFDAAADEVDWFTVIDFERSLARQYGLGRCWLAGDAAHLTSPIGMQSMNVGLREGVELAHILASILRREGSLELLTSYTARYRHEWKQLLGMENGITPTPDAVPWAHQWSARILPCVPASGDDLVQLLSQIGLTFRKV